MAPLIGTVPPVHWLTKIVDEVVNGAEGESSAGVIVANVVTLVLRLDERVVRPCQLVNFRKSGGQGALGCLRIPALGWHLALRISPAR